MGWVLAMPRTVLAVALVTALVSVIYAAKKLDVQTDQLELISAHHPLIALTERLEPYNFGGKATFTLVVQAATPERGVLFAKTLATRIEQDPKHFRDLLYRVDPNLVKPWALFYPEPAEIQQIRTSVMEYGGLIQGLSEQPDLLQLLRLVNQEMTKRMVGEMFTGFLDNSTGDDTTVPAKEPMDLGFWCRPSKDFVMGFKKTVTDLRGFPSSEQLLGLSWKAIFEAASGTY
jgi:hypothetical protein